MSMSNRGILIAAGFIAPVMCCLIGVGAFVHLANSFTQEQQPKQAGLSGKITEQKEAARVMKEKLDQAKDRISQLRRELQDTHARAEEAEKVEEQLRFLKSSEAKLEDELSSLRQKMARAEAFARNLNALRAEVAKLKSSQKNIRAKFQHAKSEHTRLLSLHNAALKKRQEKRNVFSVTALSGGGSTRARRALFAECRAEGITIQPAKTRLSANMDARAQNVFLSSVRQTGYVVFLVRPDGFESFRRYRGLVISENRLLSNPIDIGFEPVNEDWVLAYPEQKRQVYAKLNER